MTEPEADAAGWTAVVAGPGNAQPPATRGAEVPSPATRADLIDSVTRLDRAVKERRDTDETLINWWLYFPIVSWITFGFYGLYLLFKPINRIDGFSARKRAYDDALVEWTRRQAAQAAQLPALPDPLVRHLRDLGLRVGRQDPHRPRQAVRRAPFGRGQRPAHGAPASTSMRSHTSDGGVDSLA